MGLETKPLKLRLIRIELDNGETEILITSLIDRNAYPYELFSELYHERWPVEEDYKAMKHRLEVENFSGNYVLSVYQDFHAKVFSKNLTHILSQPIKGIIERNSRHKKYTDQVNFTQALSKMKDTIVLLFNRSKDAVLVLISKLHKIFIQTTEPIRPGRKYERNHKHYKREYHMCYKRTR